jgi:erythromycin esterase-like protein
MWKWRNLSAGCAISNEARSTPERKAAFYGLDIYGVNASIASVIAYLDEVDPEAAGVARKRYGCLTPLGREGRHDDVPETYPFRV